MPDTHKRGRQLRSPVSSDDSDDSRHRRERPRYRESADRHRGRDRGEEDSYRDSTGEKRRRRSFSPKHDDSNYRSRRRKDDHHHHYHTTSRRICSHSRSPPPHRRSKPTIRRSRSPKDDSHRRSPHRKPRHPSQDPTSGANAAATTATIDDIEKQKPNYATTGLLAAETNTVGGVVLKYHEPPEARKPPARDSWRLYVFKGSELLETVHLGERSCWLLGRERTVVDFPTDHPSCSKQHAVIQFRFIEKKNEFGDRDGRVRPYIIDLDSANGTSVNKEQIPASRYVELRDRDMLQFGLSTREYVLMLPSEG